MFEELKTRNNIFSDISVSEKYKAVILKSILRYLYNHGNKQNKNKVNHSANLH